MRGEISPAIAYKSQSTFETNSKLYHYPKARKKSGLHFISIIEIETYEIPRKE